MVDKVKAALLGATGLVGQRFASLLARHPWFELEVLTASRERAGTRYRDAPWVIEAPFPEELGDVRLQPTEPEALRGVELVFVALPKQAAAEIEPVLVRQGKVVVSNASNMRMEPYVPLLNPEVNWEHLGLLEEQRRMGWSGALLKVPNCSTAVLTLSLKPLHDRYGVESVHVTTMQAISGAGLRGVPAYVITDNIVPYIPGEEEKIEAETRKILGRLEGGRVEHASLEVHATATRVPVLDGHLESVHVVLRDEPGGVEEVAELLSSWRSVPQREGLPTAPERPIVVRGEADRPQPRLDRLEGGGMSVVVGRLRLRGRLLRYLVLGHNTVRGAAGTGVLIAELYYRSMGLI